MRYRVSTPAVGYTGAVGGVTFVDGNAVVDDETHAAELGYCRNAGYTIEPLDQVDDPGEDVDDPASATLAGEMPKKSAKTEDWRAYAVAQGMPVDEANAKSRDELVAQFTQENLS